MIRSKLRNSWWFSILLHSVLLLGFISWSHKQSNLKLNRQTILSTYSVNIPTHIVDTRAPKPDIALKPKPVVQQQTNSKTITTTASSIDHGTEKVLLSILHNAIAAKQVYPENALALQQSGIVTMGFWLNPDGKLTGITLLKSSGYKNIDDAAIAAVQSITNVAEAHEYITKAEYFAIDVEFE